MEPDRLEWQKRCTFNAFCKRVLEKEAANAHRDVKQAQVKIVSFSDLTPQESAQLYSQDNYFEDEDSDTFLMGGKKITTKLLAEELRTLPEEKRKAVPAVVTGNQLVKDLQARLLPLILNVGEITMRYEQVIAHHFAGLLFRRPRRLYRFSES